MTCGWKLVFIGGAIWSVCSLASLAGSIQATNRDGSTATYDNTWAGLQSAIVHAETGSANPQGVVKIWGDVSRLNASETQILITTGNVTVRGGYTEGTFSDALRSGRSKIDAASTTLGDECRVIWIDAGANNTTLDSLEITGGKSGNGSGNQAYGAAGIWVGGQSRLTNLVVHDNSTIKSGGGVIPYSGTVAGTTYTADGTVIEYCTFYNNTADVTGGGVNVIAPDVMIANSVFRDNNAGYGGAIASTPSDGVDPRLFGSLLYDNTCGAEAAAIHVMGNSTPKTVIRVINSTIADNVTSGKYGIYESLVNASAVQHFVLRNSIVSLNGEGVYGYDDGDDEFFIQHCVSDPDEDYDPSSAYTEDNHVTAWPTFLDRPNDDYRLTVDSPAVDIGTLGINTYLEVMSDADMVAAFGGVAGDYAGYTMYYVPLKSSNLYNKGLDVIVHLGGFVPDPADYLDNYIYTTDLAGKPRLAAKEKNGSLLIDAGAYEFTVRSKGTVFLLR